MNTTTMSLRIALFDETNETDFFLLRTYMGNLVHTPFE